MAREIHDTIAHGLTGIVTQLEAAEQAAGRSADWTGHVDNALRLARESLTEARRSVEASRPEALEGASLEEALRDLAQRWSALYGDQRRRSRRPATRCRCTRTSRWRSCGPRRRRSPTWPNTRAPPAPD